MRHDKITGLWLSAVLVVGLWAVPGALAEEQPRHDGVLRMAIAGPPEPGHASGTDLHAPGRCSSLEGSGAAAATA